MIARRKSRADNLSDKALADAIKTFLMQREAVSLAELAETFAIEPDTAWPLFETWIEKGEVCPLCPVGCPWSSRPLQASWSRTFIRWHREPDHLLLTLSTRFHRKQGAHLFLRHELDPAPQPC